MTTRDIIISKIIKKMTTELICHVTIGKTDNDETPYSENQINELLTEKKENIKTSAENMYDNYENDGELYLIFNGKCENDWHREYMEDLLET